MNILKRLKNIYSYGGIAEVFRKSVFFIIYSTANYFTFKKVLHSKISYGLNTEKRKDHIVVSLTSFPLRFGKITICLKSLLLQELHPDKIIVYFGNDTKRTDITEEMHELEKYGIEYRFDSSDNLMPHGKYFYAMKDYPDSIIVTADDDVVYPRNWLKSLYDSYKQYPNAVSARRVHQIIVHNNAVIPYNSWKDQCRSITSPSHQLLATGTSGVLYPPKCFDDEVFNVKVIKDICLRADDLWLKCMEIRDDIPVVWVKNWEVALTELESTMNQKLSTDNVLNCRNDEILNKLLEYYHISATKFRNEMR